MNTWFSESSQFLILKCALLITLLHWTVAVAADAKEYMSGGAKTCLMCHGAGSDYRADNILQTPHAIGANPHSPFAENNHQCEACHGPSAAHLSVQADGQRPLPAMVFDARRSAEEKNTVCLGCHQQVAGQYWIGSIHQFEQVACTDCHQVHRWPDPALAAANQAGICFDCHARVRAELLRSSIHPVRTDKLSTSAEGSLNCTDCHAPHGSASPALLVKNTVNETCYECHAEKRGPFLWEHAPVRENCAHCHVPHGSNHDFLLQARTPWLCQQCHLAQFHPSTAISGNDISTRGASRLLLSKNCMNCHNQVHGSNHPSGPGLTR